MREHLVLSFAIYRQTSYKKPLWVLVQGDYPE